MAMSKFVMIKSYSNETYLQSVRGNDKLQKFAELGVDSKGVKHEVVKATAAGNNGLVHIKCSQTGKYWTLAGHSNRIVAEADEPEEDMTSATCTLIKTDIKDTGGVIVVKFHIQKQSKWHAIVVNAEGYLETGENIADEFVISDWEKLRGGQGSTSSATQ